MEYIYIHTYIGSKNLFFGVPKIMVLLAATLSARAQGHPCFHLSIMQYIMFFL